MMRYLLCLFPGLLNAQELQLAPPRIVSDKQFFKENLTVEMAFAMENAHIQYSLNEQATAQSPIYEKAISLKETTIVQAFAIHPDFLPSDLVEREFIRVKYLPRRIQLQTAPNKSYPANGAVSLCDLQKGTPDLHDGKWLGFLGDTVIIEADFSKSIYCNNLVISTLNDKNAWILPMSKIIVYAKSKKGAWEKIASWKEINSDVVFKSTANYNHFQNIHLRKVRTSKIRIEIIPYGTLPDGHPGAGTPAWLFLDEIVFQ